MRSRSFRPHRTLFEEGSPRGTLHPQVESSNEGFVRTNNSRYCHLDLPAGASSFFHLQRRERAMSIPSTYIFTPLHGFTQEAPPEFLGPTTCLLRNADSLPAVNKGRRWLIWWNNFISFDQESLLHTNSSSRGCPPKISPLASFQSVQKKRQFSSRNNRTAMTTHYQRVEYRDRMWSITSFKEGGKTA